MVKSLFTGKSARIIQVLLTDSSLTWTVRGISKEAGVSKSYGSRVISNLIDLGFVVQDRSWRMRVRKEQELIRRLASNYDFNKWPRKSYYCRGSLYEIGFKLTTELNKRKVGYAFTGSYAMDLMTKSIRSAKIFLYVKNLHKLSYLVESLDFQIAELGGNVIFLHNTDDLVFYGNRGFSPNKINELMVVSDVQLFLDLFNLTDRTKEAAEFLLSKMVRKKTFKDDFL